MLGATAAGSFSASVELLLKRSASSASGSNEAKVSELHRVRISSDPQRTFLVLPGQGQVVDAGPQVHMLIDTAGDVQPRLKTVFEGQRFCLGDFVVGLATVHVNARPQPNLLLELECTAQPQSADVVGEFLQCIATPSVALALAALATDTASKDCAAFGLLPQHTPRHTALLFALAVTPTKLVAV